MKVEELKDLIASWLRRAGFSVSELPPPGPPASWLLEAALAGVRLRVAGLPGVNAVSMSMGVAFSREHREAVSKLTVEERVRLTARMVGLLVTVCPDCRIAVQPSIAEPQGVVVEKILLAEETAAPTVASYATRLVNAYFAVNSILWETFPPKASGQGQQMFY